MIAAHRVGLQPSCPLSSAAHYVPLVAGANRGAVLREAVGEYPIIHVDSTCLKWDTPMCPQCSHVHPTFVAGGGGQGKIVCSRRSTFSTTGPSYIRVRSPSACMAVVSPYRFPPTPRALCPPHPAFGRKAGFRHYYYAVQTRGAPNGGRPRHTARSRFKPDPWRI